MRRIHQKEYYEKNPAKRMKKLGDALLAVTQTIGGSVTISQLTVRGSVDKALLWFSFIVMILGAIGKFLTNFYSEE